jgi:MFS family permease
LLYVPGSLSVLTRNHAFRNLFVAELVVFGADWFVLVPLLVLLPRLTGSGVWGGLALALDTGINAVLLPFTGTVADRVDRKKIMVWANLAALGGIGLLLLVRTPGTAWLGLAGVSAVAVAKAFYSPAASAALPNLVDPPDLSMAYAIAGSAWGTMAVVGASLGGVLSAALSPSACFLIAVVCLALAAWLAASIRRPMQVGREAGTTAPRTFAAVGEAMRYIRARPQVLTLVTVKSAVGLGNGVLTLFPLLAASFGLTAVGTGLLFAVRGLGALVGPLMLRRVLLHRSWLLPGLALSMGVYGLSYLGVSVSRWFGLVLALVLVAHLAGGANWVMSSYALQQIVPDRLRGRVFATDMMIATLAISVSQFVVSGFVDRVAVRVLFACCATTTLCYAVAWRWLTRRRALPAAPDHDQPATGTPRLGVTPHEVVTPAPDAG